MPTNRKRRARSQGGSLDLYEWGALVVGTSASHWTDEERERLRQLWSQHGHRLTREAEQKGGGTPWGWLEFGEPGQ